MKKLALITALATIALSSAAIAQVGPRGGFNGPSITVSTVEEALKMSDDAFVTLRGKIEQRIGKEKYLFRDQTGIINVEIDSDKWRGLVVNPNDTIEIKGEVDKGWFKTEIEVDEVTKIK